MASSVFSNWHLCRRLLCLIALLSYCVSSSAGIGWVDPDTAALHHTTTALRDGASLKLVFSDEFNVGGRSFSDGSDPRWTALHKDDYTNYALQYYDQRLASTSGGFLNITTIIEDIRFKTNAATGPKETVKHYKSAMVQSWNKFCFAGGVMEMAVRLPGKASIGGLWPAIW